MNFIKFTLTPFQENRLGTKDLWINAENISSFAEYETHTAVHTRDGVYGVMEKPKEILDMLSVTDTNVGSNWIPVSERLPQASKHILFSVKGKSYTSYGFYSDGIWTDINGAWYTDKEIIAWMPSPEPYKESDK